jgi:hypothetical protein
MELTNEAFQTLSRGFASMRIHRLKLAATDPINLQLPDQRLPESLSSFIGIRCLPRLFRSPVRTATGNSRSDGRSNPDRWILLDGEWKRLELKGTGRHGFISVTKTDQLTDYVVWVDFAPVIEGRPLVRTYLFDGEFFRGERTRLRLGEVASHATRVAYFSPRTLRVWG